MSETQERLGPNVDPKIRKAVNDTMALRVRQHEEDERFVFGSPQGQRVFAALIDECGLYSPSPDAGKRAIAIGLRERILAADPKFWRAVEDAILARRIAPTNKPKITEEESEDD